jgi:hypothetical protein
MRRKPKTAWTRGAANTYSFVPNKLGEQLGLTKARGRRMNEVLDRASSDREREKDLPDDCCGAVVGNF